MSRKFRGKEKEEMYRKVYFRIRSGYEGYTGWPDENTARRFLEDSRKLFLGDGWQLHLGRVSGSCDTVTKDGQELYLHPMEFSGIIHEESIPHLERLFSNAQAFHCYATDRYESYLELSDEENKVRLESMRDEIVAEILERCKTGRRSRFFSGEIALSIGRKFAVPRMCDKEQNCGQEGQFVATLMKELAAEGKLIMKPWKDGVMVRTATATEMKSASANGPLLQPTQQIM